MSNYPDPQVLQPPAPVAPKPPQVVLSQATPPKVFVPQAPPQAPVAQAPQPQAPQAPQVPVAQVPVAQAPVAQPQTRFQPDPKATVLPAQVAQPAQAQELELPPFPTDGIDASQVMRIQPQIFTVHFTIDGFAQGLALQAMNLESLIAQLTLLATINMPRVVGWNVYDASGTLVASTNFIEYVNYITARTSLCKPPADKKAGGYRMLQAVTGLTPDFQAEQQQAKKEGRVT